jgi:hypothetical protein
MRTGTRELSTETLTAVVYCKPTYCSALNSAPPVTPSHSMVRQCDRISGQSRSRCRRARNQSTTDGMSQRTVEIPIGGT